jgi:hypothetical protein
MGRPTSLTPPLRRASSCRRPPRAAPAPA